jgi:hypothetical protein
MWQQEILSLGVEKKQRGHHFFLLLLIPRPPPPRAIQQLQQLLVRVPEGVSEGMPIPIKVGDLKLTAPCPPNTPPGTDTLLTVTVPPEPLSASVTSSLLAVREGEK